MKKVIAALALGMLIGSASVVAAAPDTVQATLAKFKIMINGKEQHVSSSPLVVNGRTYVPLAEVGKLLGYQVGYDAKSRSISLDGKATAAGETSTKDVDELGTTVADELNINISDWVPLYSLEDEGFELRIGLVPGTSPENTSRLATLLCGEKSEEFIIPRMISKNEIYTSSSGNQLLYWNGYPYITYVFAESMGAAQ